jgi:hypothetical protein
LNWSRKIPKANAWRLPATDWGRMNGRATGVQARGQTVPALCRTGVQMPPWLPTSPTPYAATSTFAEPFIGSHASHKRQCMKAFPPASKSAWPHRTPINHAGA